MFYETNETLEDVIGLLRFKVVGLEMCVVLKHVIKVLPIMELQTVPDTPDYLKGLMNLHGRCIPVIDFAERIGIERNAAPYTIETPIILCEAVNKQVGLIVDEITGVMMANKNNLQLRAEFQEEMHYFLAVVNEGNSPALLINAEHIMKTGFLSENTKFIVDMDSLNGYLQQ